MTNNYISEKIIEDILCSNLILLAELININSQDISIVSRQKTLNSGKLDILCVYKDELLLIELKVVNFYSDIIKQINNYYNDLIELQKKHRLINSPIRKVVLVIGATVDDIEKCNKENIFVIIFKPEDILSKYYENFKGASYFLNITPSDYGVVRLGLLFSTLYLLSEGNNIEKISKIENRSQKTLKNRLSVASLLNLVIKNNQEYYLTNFGNIFVDSGNYTESDKLNACQIDLLTSFINTNPFFSSITYSILSIVETVFVLSKSQYPVPVSSVQSYFVKSVGKESTWKTQKDRETATYIFLNYSCELEFISKINNNIYLGPKGLQAILLLQLNRSIKLIESQNK